MGSAVSSHSARAFRQFELRPFREVLREHRKGHTMLILLGLLLVLLFFGLGFTLHALWIVAVILFIAWLIGLVIGNGFLSWFAENQARTLFYR